MVAVSTYSWEELASPGFTDPQRQTFRAAVAQIAAQASARLPESNGRIESAVKLVLASDVTLGEAGSATVVGSASDPQKVYEVRPGFCSLTGCEFCRWP